MIEDFMVMSQNLMLMMMIVIDGNDDEFDAKRFHGDVVEPEVDDYDKYDHEEFEVMRFHSVIVKESDHCHSYEYRVAVCSICNLSHKTPKEIPVVFHNGSNCNCHVIIKQLVSSKDNLNPQEKILRNTQSQWQQKNKKMGKPKNTKLESLTV